MSPADSSKSPSTSPYPTAEQIEAIFTKVESVEELSNLQKIFADDFHGLVTGLDHSFAGEHHGYGSWFEQLGSILALLHEKTFKLDIVRVIGGGSSAWACMEAKASAKTKMGESVACCHNFPPPFCDP